MKLFSSLPIGRDLVDTFETPYGVIKFLISKSSDLLFEDLRSGWSFCFSTKDVIAQHRIIRDDKDKVIKYFSENIDFLHKLSKHLILNKYQNSYYNTFHSNKLE